MNRGLKEFRQVGAQAVLKEIFNLHDRNALESCEPKTLTHEDIIPALAYLVFMKEKVIDDEGT